MANQTNETGYVPLKPVGFVPPHLPNVLSGGTEGTVTNGGGITIDGVDGIPLKLADPDKIKPGTEVHIKPGERAIPLEEYRERREQASKERQQQKTERQRRLDELREEAEGFWEQYDIPFEYDVAINNHPSELRRGSTGTGIAKQTVQHLHVQESFTSGQLARSDAHFLCRNKGKLPEKEYRRSDSDGNEYVPAVTCETCLSFMSRWKVGGESDD